jgi:DNA-binding winged helix-turn-helix (wHTH) protein
MLYSFEDFCLDTGRRELRRSGVLISLQPQVFDLLEYLVSNREQVVGKDDLLTAIWNGRIVSEANMSTRINAARSAIGDSGAAQRLIRTVHGKGFRFVGSVREEEETVRKLAAIVAADVAGYSRLMEQDEVGTLRRLTACRAILDERIAVSRGRVFGSAGDSVVADFASAVEAVLSRRFDEATAKLLLAIEETPNFPVPYRYLAACYAHMGRLDEARDVLKRLRAITPAVIPPRIMYLRNAEHRELYLSGLRLAAGEAA